MGRKEDQPPLPKMLWHSELKNKAQVFHLLLTNILAMYVANLPFLFFIIEGYDVQVTVEDHPEEAFINISADRCWEMVQERLNQEIVRQCSLGKQGLPPLQPLGSLNGLELFGFLHPAIIQVLPYLINITSACVLS